MSSSTKEKDQDTKVTSHQCHVVAKNTLWKDVYTVVILLFSLALTRSQQENWIQFYPLKDVNKLERLQRKATRTIRKLENITSMVRLKELGSINFKKRN